MTDPESALLDAFAHALVLRPNPPVAFRGAGTLRSAFAVSELAAASIAAAGAAASLLIESMTDAPAPVVVDRALACAWFGTAVTPVGWQLPSPWDALAGDYRSADGWIRLHTNAPRHRAAALAVLGVAPERTSVAEAVEGRRGEELEAAIVAAGGCAAVMRSAHDWARHPQGSAVAREPLVHWTYSRVRPVADAAEPAPLRPLAGLRVLDLTRVIAGPVATRFLAGLGAEVLRVDPPGWEEPALVPDMTLGKRTARVDATTTVGRDALERLIAGADVLVHGYRPGALEALVPAERRRTLRPGLIEVGIDAYGYTGPWRGRRGFDSLVQMSSGIAEAGMRGAGAEVPTPLPVQALDHATGYLAAAAAIAAVTLRRTRGLPRRARVSLARTAALLLQHPAGEPHPPAALTEPGAPPTRIGTQWGPAEVLPSPLTIGGTGLAWQRPPSDLGSHEATW
jgi:crotonobetainyl-CoA:carnitine CoA-transferase CaiB-like acyl-CoA transferase